ncbi:MAG: flagellar motor switch protein FliM [candidate division KSB1 bacterium]|nr:flagellar motor switch protein FliM [candidate division KSB1 bacterium]MDZ7386520.1 flagellar motor switch protein FliM [candidate division KSB1 bacterium]MDZ7393385.1 flagellar motor switch protein FliM [candidate division KSB1 bacterium]
MRPARTHTHVGQQGGTAGVDSRPRIGHVVPYDFRHPGRLTKDQLRGIQTIHENFARALSTYLTTLLRMVVDVRFMGVNLFAFAEFVDSLPDPDCVWVFSITNLEGKGIIEVNPQMVLLIVERSFGGSIKSELPPRPITSIEQRVAERSVERFLELYRQAWERASSLTIKMESFEADPRLAQIASASESCLLFSWEVLVKELSFGLNICLPLFVLDPVLRQLGTQNWLTVSAKRSTPDTKRQISEVVESTDMILRVFLGGTTVTLKELLDFQVGDVLVLDQKIHEPLPIEVSGARVLTGRPGVVGRKKAVQIVDWTEREV